METSIKNIIDHLNENKNFHKQVQPELKCFVSDKKNPLEERYRVWKEHCVKINHPQIIHKGQFGIIGEMVDKQYPWDYDKYAEYDYEMFLHWITDINEDDYTLKEWEKIMKVKAPSVDEFKEMLIETNFGSFVMYW